MKKHELKNEELDLIGRKLLEAGKIGDDELEGIISAPHLLSGIKARIGAEEKRNAAKSFSRKPAFSSFTFFAFFKGQKGPAAFAALLIGVAAMGGAYFSSRQTAQVSPVAGVSQSGKPERKEKTLPVVPAATSTDAYAVDAGGDDPPAKVTNALYHPTSKGEPAVKANFRKRSQPREPVYESDGEFYPLTFTGSSNEIAPGAQIVRVELPRSSLFSMGVDLPGDDRSGTVKADLLISSDGVARGFRLVR